MNFSRFLGDTPRYKTQLLWLLAALALCLDLFWTSLVGREDSSAWIGSPFMAFILCVAALRKDVMAMIPLFVVILLAQPLKNLLHGGEPFSSAWLIWALPGYAIFWFGGRLLRGLELRKEKAKLPRLLPLLGTGLVAALLFYLYSNTAAWLANPNYVKSLAGWWQAQTVGVPGFPPSWYFLRASLFAQLLAVPFWFGLVHWVRLSQQGGAGLEKKESKLAVA